MKFEIKNDSAGSVLVNLGEGNGSISILHGEGIETLAVDVALKEARLCIVKNYRGKKTVHIHTLESYKFEELTELLFHLIDIGRPETVYTDGYGVGVAVKECLYPKLLSKGMVISPSGKVSYGLDEIYGRLLSR